MKIVTSTAWASARRMALLAAVALVAACSAPTPPVQQVDSTPKSQSAGAAAGRVLRGKIVGPTARQYGRAHVELSGAQFVTPRVGFLSECQPKPNSRACPSRLLATRDGGSTWHAVGSQAPPPQWDFVSAEVGFGLRVGCRGLCPSVVKTRDGGQTWHLSRALRVRPHPADFGHSGSSISFVDPSNGWIADEGVVLRTADGGRTWSRLPFTCPHVVSDWMGMALADSRHGFVVCEGEPATDLTFKELFATVDAGATWTLRSRVEHGRPGIGQIPLVGYDSQLTFASPRLGFLMAGRNGIERTTDGGRTFRPLLFTDDETDVVGMSWITHERGYVALYQGGLLRTDDGGSHWTVVYPRLIPHPVQTVAFATPTKGIGTGSDAFLSGPAAIFVTDSGGRAWEPGRPPAGATLGQPVYASPRVVLALGSFPAKSGSRQGLLRSDDAGLSWERLAVPTAEPVSISFPLPSVGFLADRSGRLFRTDDGGTNWSQVGTETGITSLQFASGRVGWAMQWPSSASNGALIRTADGGRTWESVPLPRFLRLDTIGFLDARHGWLEGFRCSGAPPSGLPPEKTSGCGHPRPTLLRTADGGASWDEIDLPFPFGYEGLDFVTPRVGFTLGDFLYRTSDGGVTWRAIVPPGL